MEIWTDGTLVVQACEKMGAVRVLRDFAVIGESEAERFLGWKTPLAVDVEADRFWAGNQLQEFRLSDASPVAAPGEKVWRVAGLGGGRLAAILPPVGGASRLPLPIGQACRLAVGRPGRWEREVALDDLGDAAAGLAATRKRPVSRAVGGDPTLTVTEHGLVVADGQRGVVAHFTQGLELLGLWHSGGTDETELKGYAAARGVLITARWAARDSHIGWLTPKGRPKRLLNSYSAYAIPAGDDRFWLVDGREVALLNLVGKTICSVRRPSDFELAVHASGPSCVIGTNAAVHIATADDEIAVRTVSVGGLLAITAFFHPDVENDESAMSLVSSITSHTLQNGFRRGVKDGHLRVHVEEVRPDREHEVEETLRAAGAIRVDIVKSA